MLTENDENKTTVEAVESLLDASDKVGIESQEDLERQYFKKAHEQQKERAEEITTIFTNYRKQQEARYEYKTGKKPVILWTLLGLVAVIIIATIVLTAFLVRCRDIDASVAAVLISGFVTSLGSVLSILTIVVKYVFPEDEDKNFNALVTSIIENDTQRIKNDNDYQIGKQK